MAVRVLREVGLDNTRNYLTRFGVSLILTKFLALETIALGAGSLTPMKVAQGYSVFANGGYYVEPSTSAALKHHMVRLNLKRHRKWCVKTIANNQ
ncbi:penicillin-binding transpeptidase domain-containing protein [Vibrio lentus]|nr:penicillin-binding transpeptidase domain-containing protein [Vibrio lentus]